MKIRKPNLVFGGHLTSELYPDSTPVIINSFPCVKYEQFIDQMTNVSTNKLIGRINLN